MVESLIQPLRKRPIPVIDWDEYMCLIKTKYEGMDEDNLYLVTHYLHLQGQVGDLHLYNSKKYCLPLTTYPNNGEGKAD